MPTSSSTTRICAMSGGLRERQQHGDGGAARLAVLDRDAAVVLVDDLLHDGEPETRAARLGGDIRLEDARHQLFGEPAAIVRDGEAHAVAVELSANLDRRRAAGGAYALQRILRILNEVVDDLADLRG